MIKRRPFQRNPLAQEWIEMENKLFPNEKHKMVARKKRKHKQTSLCHNLKEPIDNLSAYTIWIHGAAGIGKTSLTAMFPESHLFVVGGQAKALRSHYVTLQSWQQFKELVDEFKESNFKTATLDLVESVYDMCFQHVLEELNIDYPGKTATGKDDYGKSWFFIRKEFSTVISKLMSLDDEQGLIFVSNSLFSERQIEEGATVEDIHPNLTPKALVFISGAVDLIGFYRLNMKNERELLIRPKDSVMAKCRIDHRFLYTDGTPIESIPMGNSKKEAYDNFMAAFNNELEPPERKEVKRRVAKRKRS